VTASVNKTSDRLSVATTRSTDESRVRFNAPRPAGPKAAPIARNTATCGMPLRSMSPESRAETIMTIPSKASVAANDAELNISIDNILFGGIFLPSLGAPQCGLRGVAGPRPG
jgi:hypothetical protein